jgi:hypothetical protein
MQQLVENGSVGKDLTSLNYVRKYLKAITLADIATSNGESISYNAFEALKGNGLRNDLGWPQLPNELPQAFIKLWKTALTTCFLNRYSYANENRKILNTKQMGGWHNLNVKTNTLVWFYASMTRDYTSDTVRCGR